MKKSRLKQANWHTVMWVVSQTPSWDSSSHLPDSKPHIFCPCTSSSVSSAMHPGACSAQFGIERALTRNSITVEEVNKAPVIDLNTLLFNCSVILLFLIIYSICGPRGDILDGSHPYWSLCWNPTAGLDQEKERNRGAGAGGQLSSWRQLLPACDWLAGGGAAGSREPLAK